MEASNPPALLWSMLCDYFLVDQAGKYSFIGVFDRIGAASFPALHKATYVAVALEGEPNSSVAALIDVWAPDGSLIISTAESRVQFSAQGKTIFVNLLYDLRLPAPGQYSITVEANGRPAGSFAFEVYSLPPPAETR